MDIIPPPITRRTKIRNVFGDATEASKRGRPELINDTDLSNRFTQIRGVFEHQWARIGWDLTNANSIAGVRTALANLEKPIPHLLEPFVFEKTRKASSKELRESREEIRKLEALSRLAYEEEREARDRLQVAIHALGANPGDKNIQSVHERRTQRLGAATSQSAVVAEQLERRRQVLREQESYFAQSQLFDFIKSARYRLNPLAFAKGMAGLPLISWRQSADRCARFEIQSHAAEYEKFKTLEKCLRNPPRIASVAAERVEAHLRSIRPETYASATLKNEWYYLRTAIETMYSGHVPRNAVVFRVYAEYQRRTQSRGTYDLLMQEEEKLE